MIASRAVLLGRWQIVVILIQREDKFWRRAGETTQRDNGNLFGTAARTVET